MTLGSQLITMIISKFQILSFFPVLLAFLIFKEDH